MTPKGLKAYRGKLLDLDRRVRADAAVVSETAFSKVGGEAGGGISNVPIHPADLAPGHYEQEIASGLLENEVSIIQQITAALERIDRGTFGRCQKCGTEIARERLDALPYAVCCEPCAKRAEAKS